MCGDLILVIFLVGNFSAESLCYCFYFYFLFVESSNGSLGDFCFREIKYVVYGLCGEVCLKSMDHFMWTVN